MGQLQDDSQDGNKVKFRIRIMFTVSPSFSSDLKTIELSVPGCKAYMSPARANDFRNSDAVYIELQGIENRNEAERLSNNLKKAVLWAAVESGVGADIGFDDFAGGLTTYGIKALAKALNVDENLFRLSVHGIDIFEDREVYTSTWGALSVQTSVGPEAFKCAFEEKFLRDLSSVPYRCFLALRFRAEADISKDRLAKFLLSLASMEALLIKHKWSPIQKRAISNAIETIRDDGRLTPTERDELMQTFEKTHQRNILQSLRALLTRLDKKDMIVDIERIYNARSRILHGNRENKIDINIIETTRKLSKDILILYLERITKK